MFSHASMSARLLAVFLPALTLGLLCSLVLAIEGYLGVRDLRQSAEALETRSIERIAGFTELKDLINKSPISMRDIALSQSKEQRLKFLATREKAFAEFADRLVTLKKDPSAGQAEAFKGLDDNFTALLNALARFDQDWREAGNEALPEKTLVLLRDHIWNLVMPHRLKVQESIKELSNLELEHQKSLAQDAQTIYTKTRNIILFSALAALLLTTLASVLAIVMLKSMTKSLAKISAVLRRSSESVENTSVSLRSSSTQLAAATTEEAASIAETAAAMEEMNASILKTVDHVQTAFEVAERGQHDAEHGRQVVGKMLAAMNEIQESNAKLDKMVKLIEEIEDKTRVINDIVFETRLLSFNASIEAARAGAQGRGFAVVAEEVGNLAVVSGKAADEIRVLLESTTAEVNEIVRGTQERINHGRIRAEECEQAFGTMGSTLARVGQYVKGISAAAHEQDSGIKQINRAMAQLDTVTQGNSSSAEELSSQASQLTIESEDMGAAVQRLAALVFGFSAGQKDEALRLVKGTPLGNQPEKVVTMLRAQVPREEKGKGIPKAENHTWKRSA